MEKDHSNITTYIEHKHKNTGTSVLVHPQNVEKHYHSKPSGLFVET